MTPLEIALRVLAGLAFVATFIVLPALVLIQQRSHARSIALQQRSIGTIEETLRVLLAALSREGINFGSLKAAAAMERRVGILEREVTDIRALAEANSQLANDIATAQRNLPDTLQRNFGKPLREMGHDVRAIMVRLEIVERANTEAENE
jgi:2-hydroxychromene-2-carboxylate isomerase